MNTILFNKKNGFSIIEMLTCFSIILICASILFTAIYCAREKAFKATCINNERQLVCAVIMFALDEEKLPEQLSKLDGRYIDAGVIKNDFFGGSKAYALTTSRGYYSNIEGILECPKALKEQEEISYGYNIYIQNMNYKDSANASNIVVLADSNVEFMKRYEDATKRHARGLIAAFLDGHVLYMKDVAPFSLTGDQFRIKESVLEGDIIMGMININPSNGGTFHFVLFKADGTTITRMDLVNTNNNTVEYNVAATSIRIKPKGSGNQSYLNTRDDEGNIVPFHLQNGSTYLITPELDQNINVHIYNTNENTDAMGHWWMDIPEETVCNIVKIK